MVLSLLHDAVIRIGGNPKTVFLESSSLVYDEPAIGKFLDRSDEDKAIKSMGYEASSSGDGFTYLRTW
jgi:hypothetical protein